MIRREAGGAERRRSPRLTVAIPVRVMWHDAHGEGQDRDGEVTVMNCHGALLYLLYLEQPLPPGQSLRLINRANDAKTNARVIWSGDAMPDKTACMGIEAESEVSYDFWGPMAVRLWEDHPHTARPHWVRRLWTRWRDWWC